MSNLLFLVELPPDLHPTSSEPPNALLRIYLQSDLDQLLTESVVFTLLSGDHFQNWRDDNLLDPDQKNPLIMTALYLVITFVIYVP